MSDQVRIALSNGPVSLDMHLRACVDDVVDADELAHADVLYFARLVQASDVAAQLAVYPGSVVCAGSADDGTLLFAVRRGAARLTLSCAVVASVVHALLAWGVETAEADRTEPPRPSAN